MIKLPNTVPIPAPLPRTGNNVEWLKDSFHVMFTLYLSFIYYFKFYSAAIFYLHLQKYINFKSKNNQEDRP